MHMGDFTPQDFVNSARAFATVRVVYKALLRGLIGSFKGLIGFFRRS